MRKLEFDLPADQVLLFADSLMACAKELERAGLIWPAPDEKICERGAPLLLPRS